MGRQNRYEENAKIPHLMSVYNATTVKPFDRHSTQNCTLRIIYTTNGKAGFKQFMMEVLKSGSAKICPDFLFAISFSQSIFGKIFERKYSLNHQSCKITQYSKIIVKSIRYPNNNF